MAKPSWWMTMLAGLLTWQASSTRAEDLAFSSPTWISRIDAGLLPIELRTFRSDSLAGDRGESSGTVCGRLLDRGRPLVNCHVVIVPMHEEKEVYSFDQERQVLNTITDENGEYRFENVPHGEYKLTWLPAGQTRWIRRIAMRPDVKVRSAETTKLKEIRVALQAIN